MGRPDRTRSSVVWALFVPIAACAKGSASPCPECDRCAGVMCTTPPASTCVAPDLLRLFRAEGTCWDGQCSYAYSDMLCPKCPSCNSCDGLICDAPPPSECLSSTTIRTYASTGTCSGGTCEYPYTDSICPSCPSCDPCAGVVCDAPPVPECSNSSTLRTYTGPGACIAGSCEYTYTDIACPHCPSCDECAGVVCDHPFDSECVSETTLRTYALPGTCAGGECGYPYQDAACALSCAQGACSCGLENPIAITVDAEGDVGDLTSIAVDASGGVHVSYRWSLGDVALSTIRYAHRPRGGSWQIVDVDGPIHPGHWNSALAVDSNGAVHIAYSDVTSGDLRYAVKADAAAAFDVSVVDSDGDVGPYPSIAVDRAQTVHVSYYDATNADLKYAYRPSGLAWRFEVPDAAGSVGTDTSIAVDPTGVVYVSYSALSHGTRDLKLARRATSGAWSVAPVDTSGDAGSFGSLEVDAAGGLHVSYRADGQLKYAHKPIDGAWSLTIVDAAPTRSWTSLAVDSLLGVHISYYDQTNADLRYAYKSPAGTWTMAALDTTSDVGLCTSVAVDDVGVAHVSYYDYTNANLKLASWVRCP